MTNIYGKTVGYILRLSIIVCIIYGGLLFLTGWQFTQTPTGFIPQQDKGYLILNVQLPDAASVDRTEKVMARIEKIARGDKKEKPATEHKEEHSEEKDANAEKKPIKHYPGMPGIAHTVGVSGQSLILKANAPNLGSMYILLEEFDKRHDPDLSADAIAADLEALCRDGGLHLSPTSPSKPSRLPAFRKRPCATSNRSRISFSHCRNSRTGSPAG